MQVHDTMNVLILWQVGLVIVLATLHPEEN